MWEEEFNKDAELVEIETVDTKEESKEKPWEYSLKVFLFSFAYYVSVGRIGYALVSFILMVLLPLPFFFLPPLIITEIYCRKVGKELRKSQKHLVFGYLSVVLFIICKIIKWKVGIMV